ncbi:hypothetical protein AURDEDRAFT_156459 [Auricularia subglabra TFB-10046 SS5]|nr:hypothetical protein AURDEDRAFT_156459 [Auricularia subglabra TFB-10046 SS5]
MAVIRENALNNSCAHTDRVISYYYLDERSQPYMLGGDWVVALVTASIFALVKRVSVRCPCWDHATEDFTIGIYLELNGHSTVLFSPALFAVRTHEPGTPAQATVLKHLNSLTVPINQAIGDVYRNAAF